MSGRGEQAGDVEARRTTPLLRWSDEQFAALITAVQFLTRVPLRPRMAVDASALRRSVVYFPLVGAAVGLFTSSVIGVGLLFWPAWLAVLLGLAAEAWLTGAFHEDALADFCDAFGGGWTREQVLEILKDSRLGTFGVVGLVIGIGLRAAATVLLIEQSEPNQLWWWAAVVVAAATMGRWLIVTAMMILRPIEQRASLSRDVAAQLNWREWSWATVCTIPGVATVAIAAPLRMTACLIAAGSVAGLVLRLVRRRLEGVTGDCLGCIGFAGQLVVLLTAAARFSA